MATYTESNGSKGSWKQSICWATVARQKSSIIHYFLLSQPFPFFFFNFFYCVMDITLSDRAWLDLCEQKVTLDPFALSGNGKWETGNGKWETGYGKRETGNGIRETGNGKRDTGNGKRETGNGKRETGNGKRDTGYGIRDTDDSAKNKSCLFWPKLHEKVIKKISPF